MGEEDGVGCLGAGDVWVVVRWPLFGVLRAGGSCLQRGQGSRGKGLRECPRRDATGIPSPPLISLRPSPRLPLWWRWRCSLGGVCGRWLGGRYLRFARCRFLAWSGGWGSRGKGFRNSPAGMPPASRLLLDFAAPFAPAALGWRWRCSLGGVCGRWLGGRYLVLCALSLSCQEWWLGQPGQRAPQYPAGMPPASRLLLISLRPSPRLPLVVAGGGVRWGGCAGGGLVVAIWRFALSLSCLEWWLGQPGQPGSWQQPRRDATGIPSPLISLRPSPRLPWGGGRGLCGWVCAGGGLGSVWVACVLGPSCLERWLGQPGARGSAQPRRDAGGIPHPP